MGVFRNPGRKDETASAETASDHIRSLAGVDREKNEPIDSPNIRGYNGKQDPFAAEDDDTDADTNRTKYRTMDWWQAGVLMIAETVSVGILSLPSALAALGFVPGMILLFGLGCLATYTGFVIGQFKLRYPHVHNMADAGEILLGPVGREVFGAAQVLLLVFVMGSHVLTFSIALNALSAHATCSIVFAAVGAVVQLLLALPRTLGAVSYMAVGSFVSIIAAVIITMVGVGVQRPDPHPDVTVTTTLAPAFLATSNIVFAFGGHVAFFSFISELKDPRSYPKALLLLQISDTSLYLIVAAVIYAFAGSHVASPALGSASDKVMKAAYGVALPTIVIAGVINGHVAAKYVYVRLFRGTGLMGEKSLRSYGIWAVICTVLWVVAWVVAEAIPTFNDLLGLITSLFAAWFTYGLSGVFWLFMNWGQYGRNWRKMSLTVLNVVIFLIGGLICGLGLYASGLSIAADAKMSSHGAFSCADNSS